jgi:hypothetical protein
MFGFTEAQSAKDTASGFSFIHFGYAFQIPAGHLSERFGSNSSINTGFHTKTKSNFLFGLDGSFLFGKDVKETGILDSINTSTGLLITSNGELLEPRLAERGYTINGSIGKIFPVSSRNMNSGIMVELAGGFLQHKIRIEDNGTDAPQISKEYKKGYDRLTNGFYLQGFAGYIFFSKNSFINVFGGFNYGIGFTQNRRSFNFDTQEQDTRKRKDVLFGPKVGFIIPFYSKNPEPYYYK